MGLQLLPRVQRLRKLWKIWKLITFELCRGHNICSERPCCLRLLNDGL